MITYKVKKGDTLSSIGQKFNITLTTILNSNSSLKPTALSIGQEILILPTDGVLHRVKKGETIKFIVQNLGEMVHEYNIATKEMHIKNQPEMEKMVEHEILLVDKIDMDKMKKMSKEDHSLSHSHSNSVLLEPKKTGELVWKFSKNIDLEMACNVPGHYQIGMVGKIIIE